MEMEEEEEWEVVKYEEEIKEKNRRGWGWGWGVNLGKKSVIAGIAVISFPVVVVISAVGLAVWVPYGVMFASYVGTEKVMSKLLPLPEELLPVTSISSSEDDAAPVITSSSQTFILQQKPQISVGVGLGRRSEEEEEVNEQESSDSSTPHHHPQGQGQAQAQWGKQHMDSTTISKHHDDNEASISSPVPVVEDDGDDTIWKKIDAIRGIVGIKAPPQHSYFEELKALYLFTGIHPPSHISHHFHANLTFLMTLIGLK